MLVWLAMVTGACRGELCALTWGALDSTSGVLSIRTSIAQASGGTWADTKTLDATTVELLRLYRERRTTAADIAELNSRPRQTSAPRHHPKH